MRMSILEQRPQEIRGPSRLSLSDATSVLSPPNVAAESYLAAESIAWFLLGRWSHYALDLELLLDKTLSCMHLRLVLRDVSPQTRPFLIKVAARSQT
jgi:hypothetical protein